MVAPRLYIFGVPDGFDMLEGTRQEISYFQRFYDGSTEDTKFTSHRDSNGNVTYTFLKYNLTSGKSRTGSFFGMSLAFSGVYCNHPLRLYELFDYVYHNHILCNTSDASKGILKPIANSDIKAQYLITRFENRKEHIKFVEKVFLHNLATDDMLTSSFYPLNPGFKNENQNLVVKLPLVVEFEDEKQKEIYRGRFEELLIGRFCEYSYVTISPDWKPKVVDNTKEPDPDVEIAPQIIVQWKDSIPEYQRYIIQGLGNLANIDKAEVLRYQKQVEIILGQLKKYSYNKNIAPSIQANYEELCNQLAGLYSKAKPTVSVSASPANGGTVTGGGTYKQGASCTVTALANKGYTFVNWIEGGNVVSTDANYTFNVTGNCNLVAKFTGRGGSAFWGWIIKNKAKVAGIIGAVAFVVVLLALVLPKLKPSPKPDPNPSYCCADSVNKLINNALTTYDFKRANEIADTISDKDFREEKLAMIEDRLSQYHTDLGKEIDQLISEKKWKEAFEKTGQYFDEDSQNTKINEIRIKCVDDFTTKIDEVNESNYSSMSSSLKKELLAVKSYIGNEYDELEKKLDKKKPKEVPGQKNTYSVELWNDNTRTTRLNNDPNKGGRRTFSNSQQIDFVENDYFEFRLIKNNSAINLSKSALDGSLISKIEIKNGWVNIKELKEGGNIKIKEANIDIQFKLKNQ